MTMTPLPATLLHDRMSEWWRPLALDLDGEIVDRRRRGVEALRRALTPRNAVDAVAYAHGDELAGRRVIDLVRNAARSADAGYVGRVGDAEPPALVAAALADQLAVAPDADLSTLVSLLILCGAYSRVAPAIAEMPLAEYAQRQLEHVSASLSRTQPPPMQSAGELIRELLGEAGQPSGHNGSRTPALDRGALAALAARIDELTVGAARANAELREQLRRQAWVTDPWCESAAAPWEQVEADARPLLAAVELADRTLGITPAGGAPALLRRLLAEPARSFGLDEGRAVAAAGPLLDGRLARAPHRLLFPLSTRLREWRDRDDLEVPLEDWRPLPAWGTESNPGLEIARQCYREALALRALDDD
jgi:hypothetical protein